MSDQATSRTEIPMNVQRVAEIAAHFAETAPVKHVVFLGEGHFTAAWLINGAVVLRLAKHAAAAASLRREACLLPDLARQLPLPIPQPRCQQLPGDPPVVASVHRLLEGEGLTVTEFVGLSARCQAAYAHSVGVFLARLHHCGLDRARACGVATMDYRGHFAAVADAVEQHLAGSLDPSDRVYVRSTLGAFLSDEVGRLRSCALLHADLSPSHVLWDPKLAEVTGIIDFGDMIIGDGAQDLAGLYDDFGPAFVRDVLAELPDGDRETLVRRVYRLYELSVVEWAVDVLDQQRCEEFDDALAAVLRLRLDASREPWRRML
jgi:aminoglycoside phosphotransferase (APT) family kinase protein